ncbi:hypothetical protein Zmor_013408 [Zophobas morio]|uniref:Regucalcin n=1 Tax=Zophobas morio TaxID=2755281 RepID=A0AA38MFJ8_9CUCU|nr:hypothetical protein Zmor_013408 [Zophobas morio]
MPTVEKVTESCGLGEGPHWDASSQSLFLVDVPRKQILKYTPSTNKLTKVTLEKQASFVIPVDGKKNEFVISQGNELAIISWDGESDNIKIVQNICGVETSTETPKSFNDAKCDSLGKLWAGTLSIAADFAKTQPVGTLYSIDTKKQLKSHVDKIFCSNGLAFNDQTQKMFYIDSLAGSVDQFDFDLASATISNRKPWFTLKKLGIPGFPDGMTIDSDGNLWVAVFGGSRVLKLDGHKSETLLDTVNIQTEQVTSVAFGGPNLDELYVTTGGIEFGEMKPSGPGAGAVYRVTGLGTKGLPAVNFKLNV